MIGKKKNTTSRMRHRVLLQQEKRTSDTIGGYVRTWQDVAYLWAEIMPKNGNEKLFSGQLQSKVSHTFLLRFRADISAGMRFLFDQRTFNIVYVTNVGERGDMMEVFAEEGAID